MGFTGLEKSWLETPPTSFHAKNFTHPMMPQVKFDSEVFLCYTIGDHDGTYMDKLHEI